MIECVIKKWEFITKQKTRAKITNIVEVFLLCLNFRCAANGRETANHFSAVTIKIIILTML